MARRAADEAVGWPVAGTAPSRTQNLIVLAVGPCEDLSEDNVMWRVNCEGPAERRSPCAFAVPGPVTARRAGAKYDRTG